MVLPVVGNDSDQRQAHGNYPGKYVSDAQRNESSHGELGQGADMIEDIVEIDEIGSFLTGFLLNIIRLVHHLLLLQIVSHYSYSQVSVHRPEWFGRN